MMVRRAFLEAWRFGLVNVVSAAGVPTMPGQSFAASFHHIGAVAIIAMA
jgi:hypothetical protein